MKCQQLVTNAQGKWEVCGAPVVWDITMRYSGAREITEEIAACNACAILALAKDVLADATLQDVTMHRNQD